MPIHSDICPLEAVKEARRDAAEGQSDAWEVLDRVLRWHVLRALSDGQHVAVTLSDAFLDAIDWARSSRKMPWAHTWPALFDLLRDGDRSPSLAKGLRALEGRAAEILSYLAARNGPARSMRLKESLKISQSEMTKLLQRLETARLLVTRDGNGHTRWVVATPRGIELGKHLLPLVSAKLDTVRIPSKVDDISRGVDQDNPEDTKPIASEVLFWRGAREPGSAPID